MPYKSSKIKLPREFDRRVKITTEMKKDILRQYDKGTPIRQISRNYPDISRRSIQYVIFPERLALVHKQAKDREQWRMSYAKVKGKKWAKQIASWRKYKQSLYLKGLIG